MSNRGYYVSTDCYVTYPRTTQLLQISNKTIRVILIILEILMRWLESGHNTTDHRYSENKFFDLLRRCDSIFKLLEEQFLIFLSFRKNYFLLPTLISLLSPQFSRTCPPQWTTFIDEIKLMPIISGVGDQLCIWFSRSRQIQILHLHCSWCIFKVVSTPNKRIFHNVHWKLFQYFLEP